MDTPNPKKDIYHFTLTNLKAFTREPVLSFCRWRNQDAEKKVRAMSRAMLGTGCVQKGNQAAESRPSILATASHHLHR